MFGTRSSLRFSIHSSNITLLKKVYSKKKNGKYAYVTSNSVDTVPLRDFFPGVVSEEAAGKARNKTGDSNRADQLSTTRKGELIMNRSSLPWVREWVYQAETLPTGEVYSYMGDPLHTVVVRMSYVVWQPLQDFAATSCCWRRVGASGQLSVSRSKRSRHERSVSRYSMFHYFVISQFLKTCRSACFAKD